MFVSLTECKPLYLIRSAFYRLLGNSRSHKIRQTKNSRTKIMKSRRNGKNVRFIEREKTRCLWNVPSTHLVGPPLKKMTPCSRRGLERTKSSERAKEKKRDDDHLSFVSYRNAKGNGWSGKKFSYFLKTPSSPLFHHSRD